MIQKLIHSVLRPRHPWRDVKFDELAEIYTSMTLRTLGFSLIGIFVPVFLYKSGVSLESIFFFYFLFFLFRLPVDYCSAFLVGRIGPKHALGLSTVLYIMFLILLLTFNIEQWPLWLLAAIFSTSNGIFFIAYHTDFSKIKSSKHGGKELSYLYIFERFGGVLGPLIGGLLASFVAPEATIIIAIFVLLGSQIPLFLSSEPVRTHQKIKFKNFPWKRFKYDYISLSANGIDRMASLVAWPLLISVTVFVDDSYAKIGVLVAVSTVLSIIIARYFGRLIDNHKGLSLLKIGVITNSLVHLARPFLLTTTGAASISLVNEPVTLASSMPVVKGFYDQTDSIEGYRIVYITSVELVLAVIKGFYFLGLLVFSQFYNPVDVLSWSFIVVAIATMGVLFQRFPALKRV
jgi:MFS family permease